MSKKTKIYRNFNHWWTTSEAHGMTSVSRDWIKDIWDDIEPTIRASRDDYKQAYINMMNQRAKRNLDIIDAMLEYIEEHKQVGQKGFWRWWIDKENV